MIQRVLLSKNVNACQAETFSTSILNYFISDFKIQSRGTHIVVATGCDLRTDHQEGLLITESVDKVQRSNLQPFEDTKDRYHKQARATWNR